MKIVVLIKEVQDTYGERRLDLETGLADRAGSERVLDEIGERALEVALSYADRHAGTDVVALSMAPEDAAGTMRKALALGAGSAIQIVDDALIGADLGLTAEVLAAALRRIGFDLVILGNQSTDGGGGVLPAMVAELLDVPLLGALASVELAEGVVRGVRTADGVTLRLAADLPAILSVTEQLPDARFPNIKSVMAAKKKAIETLSLADLAVDPEDPDASRSIVLAVARRPERSAGITVVDDGTGGQQIAEFLIQRRLV